MREKKKITNLNSVSFKIIVKKRINITKMVTYRLFLTSLPLTRTATTIHGQDTTERILGLGNEAEAPSPCTTETKSDSIRRERGMTAGWLHCPSPRPAQQQANRSPLSLQFLQ